MSISWCQPGTYAEGCGAPPKKATLSKIKEKELKIDKIKKIDQNYHNVLYKWVKKDEFLKGNSLTPNFLEVRTSPKLILHTPLVSTNHIIY